MEVAVRPGRTIPGGTTDTQYSIGVNTHESATISPNGWWITVKDAVEEFFLLNPRLALITH